ncbi:MAG: hypothetical protein L3J82_01825 [Planctomycetes bacterium]|nr:hypothetical protein [Planctomycetota bacterium]
MFAEAKESNKAVVLYFGNMLLTDDWLKEVDLADFYGKGLVICVRVKEKKKEAEAVETGPDADSGIDTVVSEIIPGNKLEATNLWAAYGVKKSGTIIIADLWGNEYRRTKSQKLEALVIKMTRDNKKLQKKLNKSNSKAKSALGSGDLKTASKELLKVFKADKFGWDQTDTASTLFEELVAKGREQIASAKGDAEKLETLKKSLKGTGLEKEVTKSLEGIN